MQEESVQKKVKADISIQWLCQLIASLSWFASVIVYGSFELGDCLQLSAASAWAASNIMNYFANRNHVVSQSAWRWRQKAGVSKIEEWRARRDSNPQPLDP